MSTLLTLCLIGLIYSVTGSGEVLRRFQHTSKRNRNSALFNSVPRASLNALQTSKTCHFHRLSHSHSCGQPSAREVRL
ncbi:hypothetical protein C8J56DRAFT_982342, partial [Mycena floridula]